LLSYPLTDAAILVARLLLGVFFILARFRLFFDPSVPAGSPGRWLNGLRWESFTNKLCYCGCRVYPRLWAWIAGVGEVLAGIALVLGLFTIPAALVLLVILLVATRCTAYQKVMEQNPVDRIDCVACYLWRVEGLYIGLAIIILLAGPGAYSIDYLIWR
jgi:uncharacterized membrane protein YphA (DoxX/SURF4 family)